MKQFDCLYANKFSINIDGKLTVFRQINVKLGGAIIKTKNIKYQFKIPIFPCWFLILSQKRT